MQDYEARAIAVEAVRTVPDLDTAHLQGFLDSINRQEPAPTIFHQGLPVWRFPLPDGPEALPISGLSRPRDRDHVVLSGDYIGIFHQSSGGSSAIVAPVDIVPVAILGMGGEAPSPAETRLACLLLSGLSLSEAAERDGVSYQTRRNQFKSLAARMNLSRQQDVVRVLLQELLLALIPAIASHNDNVYLHDYAERFLPDGVRVSVLGQRDGPPVRIVDYGPLSGRPLMVLHPMIFQDITTDNVAFAAARNVRLIFPLRPGLLEPDARWTNHQAHRAEALASVETAWNQMCCTPVAVLALVSSGALATEFAARHPDKVTSITYAATCFTAGHYRPSATYFGSSVAELALRNEAILSKTMAMLKRQFSPRDRFKPTIERIFSGSSSDTAVLKREFGPPHRGDRIMSAVLDSEKSIKQDYFNQVHFDWSEVRKLRTPVRFVHGDCDSIHSPDDMEKLRIAAGSPPLTEVAGVGHLFQYDDFDALLADVLAQ